MNKIQKEGQSHLNKVKQMKMIMELKENLNQNSIQDQIVSSFDITKS